MFTYTIVLNHTSQNRRLARMRRVGQSCSNQTALQHPTQVRHSVSTGRGVIRLLRVIIRPKVITND